MLVSSAVAGPGAEPARGAHTRQRRNLAGADLLLEAPSDDFAGVNLDLP